MEDRDLPVRFRAMADAVPVLIWTTGLDAGCTFLNRRWLEFTGRDLDDELGLRWTDNVHPDDVDRCLADFREASERREPFETEYRLRRADGEWRWILVRGVPHRDADGSFAGYIGSGIDLTERREADQALQRSREQLAAAMAAGRMGTFDLDLATGRVARDRNLEELYGLEPGGASTFAEWASLIHPDDRAMVLEEVARVATEGGEYRLEHRLVRGDGEIRWLERRGHTYAADGRLAGIRGVVVDITKRKVAERERTVLFERVARLQRVTAALARAGTPDEVLETMVTEGVDALGASAGSVAIVDREGAALEVARSAAYPQPLLEAFRRMDLSADVPLAEAARTGAPVVCGDLDELARRYPEPASRPATGNNTAAAFPLVVDERVIGAVGLSFAEPQAFDQAQMEFQAAVVAQCAQALDRAWSYSAEAAARQAAEEARARLALLAEASGVLAGSMEYEATLPEVARRAIPLLGDCCVIDVFGDDQGGKWRRVAAVHVDPRAHGKLLTIPPEAWAAADAVDEAETLRDLDLRSALVVPLQARDRTLGMLALGRREAGAFSAADRSLSEALGARVAQAVDNALLYRAERAAHEEAEAAAARLRFLLDVTTTLASPLAPDERLEALARQAAQAVCDLCVIDLVERDGSIRRVAAATADPALQPLADALRRLMAADPDGSHPSAAAIRTGLSELCPEVTEERLRSIATSAAHFEAARQIQPLSYVVVPLVGLGAVLGAIALVTTTTSGRRYGPSDLVLAEDMASRVAMGLETASMHEDMRRVAHTLQASLLPPVPPAIPGLEVGTRYVAAEEGAVVGGDFFDVFALGPDAWAVVVGDVCGQGVEAATVTGLARHTVRSSAIEHESPASVLSHLNDVLLGMGAGAGEGDPRFCTVCLSRLELTSAGAAVTLAVGGHPLPYVVGGGGEVRQVGRPGSLLGVMEGARVSDEQVEIGPGDALVLYTDGITERHLGASFFGEAGLEQALADAVGLTADEIAARIEESARRFVEGQPADDMAVVVVRVPPR
ncbi:MAG TPA: SpoIIE family protein phosphatase [Acidimicrobiales bacterium]|nr:SpoIIE family protein phosphatase [Acidimicrobiales bacterium]